MAFFRRVAVNPLYQSIANYLTILLLLTAADVLPLSQAEEEVPIPFKVIWNYPDKPCVNRNIYSGVTNFGILRNSNMEFVGDQVGTLYTADNRHGRWPKLATSTNGTEALNGGLPQLANLTAHLIALENSIEARISDDADGYGVIDLEMWRPLLRLNWGKHHIYVEASIDLARQTHPNMTNSELKEQAALEWGESARELMEKSIEVLQAARPNMHWGYYTYPYLWTWNAGGQSTNNEMEWLYRTINGFYPSIYTKDVLGTTSEDKEKRVKNILFEAMRVKHLYGKPGSIIAAYSLVQNEQVYFNESDLYNAIGLSADMGLDAVILWGASSFLHGNGCTNIHNFVHSSLGPYVVKLTERLTNCSRDRCSGRGRCVRKDFAWEHPYIRKIAADTPTVRRQIHEDDAKVTVAKTTSSSTPLSYPQSNSPQGIKSDESLHSFSTAPATSYNVTVAPTNMTLNSMNTTSRQQHLTHVTQHQTSTIPPDTSPFESSTEHQYQSTGAPNENTSPTHGNASVADVSTSAQHESTTAPLDSTSAPPDYGEYNDYLCQCYKSWDGPTCEDSIEGL